MVFDHKKNKCVTHWSIIAAQTENVAGLRTKDYILELKTWFCPSWSSVVNGVTDPNRISLRLEDNFSTTLEAEKALEDDRSFDNSTLQSNN